MNMKYSHSKQPMKRALLGLMALGPWLVGCNGLVVTANAHGADPQRRFKSIGIVLVVDAVPEAEMKQAAFYDDRGTLMYGPSLVTKRNRSIMALGGTRVPLAVKAIWRKGAGWDDIKKVWNEGTIIGSYTIPVAERIPDEVLDDIRTQGGSLRLKFRLKPDGVLFGWDIERDGKGSGHVLKYDLPGGDFLESYY
jgi:hypothetical protein